MRPSTTPMLFEDCPTPPAPARPHLFAVLLGNLILCKDRAPRLDRCRLALPEKQVVEHLILERVDKLIRRQTVRPRAVSVTVRPF
jgi:hypothetical protein